MEPTAAEQFEASQQVCQQLNSVDHTGAPTSAKRTRGGQEAIAPQINYCLAAVGHTSCDGNKGGSKFKARLINKLKTNWNCTSGFRTGRKKPLRDDSRRQGNKSQDRDNFY